MEIHVFSFPWKCKAAAFNSPHVVGQFPWSWFVLCVKCYSLGYFITGLLSFRYFHTAFDQHKIFVAQIPQKHSMLTQPQKMRWVPLG